MKLKRYKKENIEIFVGLMIFNFIVLSNFFKMHYAQDTYCIISSGFSYIARNAFLWSGRPITAVVFYLADFLNVSMSTHIFIMACISIVSLSTAIYILYRTIMRMSKNNKMAISIIIILLSYITILNFCTMDLQVFAESGILSIGLLFSIMAACEWLSNNKLKYLKIGIYTFIGVLCYQAVLNIYVPLGLMIVAIKNKDNVKKAFIEAFTTLFIYGVALILSMMVAKVINVVLQMESRPTIVPTISHIFNTYAKYLKFMVIDTLDVGPKYWYIILMSIITILYFSYNIIFKRPKINLFYYVAILLSAILVPILPLIVQAEEQQYLELRMTLSFGASIGIMLIYTFLSIKESDKNWLKLISVITILMFIFNGQYIVRASGEMISANLLDRNFAETILYNIEQYEKENNLEIKKVAIDYDMDLEFYYSGSEKYRCLNLKSLATDWAIIGILETYSDKEFIRTEVPENIHDEYFRGKNWTCYDEEQLVFIDDTLYICIY